MCCFILAKNKMKESYVRLRYLCKSGLRSIGYLWIKMYLTFRFLGLVSKNCWNLAVLLSIFLGHDSYYWISTETGKNSQRTNISWLLWRKQFSCDVFTGRNGSKWRYWFHIDFCHSIFSSILSTFGLHRILFRLFHNSSTRPREKWKFYNVRKPLNQSLPEQQTRWLLEVMIDKRENVCFGKATDGDSRGTSGNQVQSTV